MNKKTVQVITACILAVLALGCLGFYIYDVVWNNSPYQDNLLKLVLIFCLAIASFIRMFRGGSRASLSFYENAYAKELGGAFQHSPALRKKLVSATRLYDESNYRKALKLLFTLAKEAKSENDLVPVLLFSALCYTDMGLTDYAIKVYYNILESSPRNSQVHSNLAGLHLQQGDFKLALSHYDEAINCDHNNYFAYNNRANCYFRMQEYDKAIDDAKKALEIKNNGVEAATLLAVIFALKGDEENKEKYYRLATVSGRPAQEIDRAIQHHINTQKDESIDE